MEGTGKNVEDQLAVDQEAAREYLCLVHVCILEVCSLWVFKLHLNLIILPVQSFCFSSTQKPMTCLLDMLVFMDIRLLIQT